MQELKTACYLLVKVKHFKSGNQHFLKNLGQTLEKNQTSIALTDNKRIQNNHIVGTGYYNTWADLKISVPPESTAFTRHLNAG